jgi:hypothetical protein
VNKYKVWDPNNGNEDDAKEIEASDVEHAAAKYAEKCDSDREYAFTEGEGVNLLVRKVGGEYIASVLAYGEQTIHYGARLMNERDFE